MGGREMASFRINGASAYMNEVPDEENSRSVGPMASTINKRKHFNINKWNNVTLRTREIGIGFTGFGIFFILLGVVLLFDHGFLAIGNLLFVSGVILTMGQKSSLEFFMKRQKFKGTLVFVLGFSLLLVGFPVIGTAIESYGLAMLLRDSWPGLSLYAQRLPGIGWILRQPCVCSLLARHRPRRVPV